MTIEIHFKNLEHTPTLDEMIKKKSHKIEKLLQGESKLRWNCWIENEDQCCSILANSAGKEFFVKASSDNLYKSFDLAITKMTNQLQHAH